MQHYENTTSGLRPGLRLQFPHGVDEKAVYSGLRAFGAARGFGAARFGAGCGAATQS